jgi:glycosyltransferase involved in cell wall biosynthesis
LGPGGLERQLYYLLKAMDRERYKPMVVAWNYRENDLYVPQIRDLGVQVFPISGAFSRVAKLLASRRLVRKLRPEVIHSYCFYTNVVAWWATLGYKAIGIGSIRGDFINERRRAGRILGRMSACLPVIQICNSLAAKNNAERFAWVFRPTRILPVRNGLDINLFTFHPLSQRKPLLLAVGRLYPEKRWDRLLECVALVAAKGLDFSVYLAGDGPLRAELESQARRLGVYGLVQFLGLRRDIPDLLKSSTFLVHTADGEGCPNVVMEAMACGRAVVATDAGDVPLLVEDGKTGFVVRRGEDAALVDRMIRLITDRELCRRMGEAGRAKAEQEFGLDRLVAETLGGYRNAGWKDV